jgi:hypothetical protein
VAYIRIIVLLLAVAIAVSAVLFLVTRDRKYLRFSHTLAKYAIAAALIGFGLLALEKLT